MTGIFTQSLTPNTFVSAVWKASTLESCSNSVWDYMSSRSADWTTGVCEQDWKRPMADTFALLDALFIYWIGQPHITVSSDILGT